ncbi:DUF3592 domain-containing protein [Ruegeria sp. 2012CJ15-1]|uniref:DUF3592 domain-containing protein n=1 Tax=Ruegeria hyattellae TaxID=3233337 RepID=UPI00355C583F
MGLACLATFIAYKFGLILGPRALSFFGWGFFCLGMAMVLPPAIAAGFWQHTKGHVSDARDNEDMQIVRFNYSMNGSVHSGEIKETGNWQPGDTIGLLVNPSEPTQYFAPTNTRLLLGSLFVVFGALIGSGLLVLDF